MLRRAAQNGYAASPKHTNLGGHYLNWFQLKHLSKTCFTFFEYVTIQFLSPKNTKHKKRKKKSLWNTKVFTEF